MGFVLTSECKAARSKGAAQLIDRLWPDAVQAFQFGLA
jgi:hypothetical protein